MSIDLKVYDNGDHTCLIWLPDNNGFIPDCRGFAIRRILNKQEGYLHGFVGFSDTDEFDSKNPWKYPLQRYMWWDYGVFPRDVVRYSIIPVVGTDQNHLKLSTTGASELTPAMTITGQVTPHMAAYFNKGIVAAQWVSRALAKVGKNANLSTLIGTPENELRNSLSGLLRIQLLALLDDAKKNNGELYAALYELNDPELIDRLTSFGRKCHLLLANGAFKSPDNDENKDVREKLRDVVDLYDRMVTGNHFAHNKFLVVCDSQGNPQSVLSGSTNWTMTGLCTQANNGVIVDDPDLAADFLNEWKLLKEAGNEYPASLANANSTAKTIDIDGCRITQWFAPTSDAQDLEYARKLINAAQEGILFLFFNPGAFVSADKPAKEWTLLQNILVRHHADSPNYNAGLYLRGVVNQEIAGLTKSIGASNDQSPIKPALDPSVNNTPVLLFNGGDESPTRLTHESMVPKNIKDTFHNWAAEMLGTGVHIHSKVIVLDPFGKNPVVMTGSHNLGYKASTKNDDNLMIVEGNAPLAAAFAVNIIAIYESYRWNNYVEAHRNDPRVWHGLVDNDQWQHSYLKGSELAEIQFWMGNPAPVVGGSPISNAAMIPAKSVRTLATTKLAKQTSVRKTGKIVTTKSSRKITTKKRVKKKGSS